MGVNSVNSNVLCPFYIREKGDQRIHCEGCYQKCSTCLSFYSKTEKVKHLKQFCEDQYEECRVYKMLMREKYKE